MATKITNKKMEKIKGGYVTEGRPGSKNIEDRRPGGTHSPGGANMPGGGGGTSKSGGLGRGGSGGGSGGSRAKSGRGRCL